MVRTAFSLAEQYSEVIEKSHRVVKEKEIKTKAPSLWIISLAILFRTRRIGYEHFI